MGRERKIRFEALKKVADGNNEGEGDDDNKLGLGSLNNNTNTLSSRLPSSSPSYMVTHSHDTTTCRHKPIHSFYYYLYYSTQLSYHLSSNSTLFLSSPFNTTHDSQNVVYMLFATPTLDSGKITLHVNAYI